MIIKKNILQSIVLGFLVTIFSFSACSYHENDNNQTEGIEHLYMSVKISTRAGSEKVFDKGEAQEYKLNRAIFLFFDKGEQVAEPFDYEVPSSSSGNVEGGETIGHPGGTVVTYEPIVILKNPKAIPTRLFVIANPSNSLRNQIISSGTSLNMSNLLSMSGDYYDVTSGFLMSNSTYKSKLGEVEYGQKISPSDLKKSEALAKDSPVHVYLERVLAKVHVNIPKNIYENASSSDKIAELQLTHKGKKYLLIDNQYKVKLSVKFLGAWLDNLNSESLLLKKLENTYSFSEGTWEWNDYNRFRSYWCSPQYGDFLHSRFSGRKPFTEDIDNAVYSTDFYAQENTDKDNPTQLVVATQFDVFIDEDCEEQFTGLTEEQREKLKNNLHEMFYKDNSGLFYYKGRFYTKEYLQNYLLQKEAFKDYYYKDGSEYKHLEAVSYTGYYENVQPKQVVFYNVPKDDVSLTSSVISGLTRESLGLKQYEEMLIPQVVEGTELYKKSSSGEYEAVTDLQALNDEWANNANMRAKVYMWRNMKGYYYAPIKHVMNLTDGAYINAIVRNHKYNMNIKSVYGLGTPVPFVGTDANDQLNPEILPVIPEYFSTYIGVVLEVLRYDEKDWTIDFES